MGVIFLFIHLEKRRNQPVYGMKIKGTHILSIFSLSVYVFFFKGIDGPLSCIK